MNFERQKRLVERLLDKTRAGQMPWEETPDEETFELLISNNKIQIKQVGSERFPKFQIRISDEQDVTTDAFSGEQLERSELRDGLNWEGMMQELYMLARRRSLRADEVLDNILMEIG